MPTLSTSELPKPKSWDEFEEIVWDIFKRKWNDPDAKRYGRSGQAQQGVDVYGRPRDLVGRYAGVQCKRYDEGQLDQKVIENEIVKADTFQPALARFIIATTAPRDAVLQRAVREINQARQSAGKFEVDILFWDDITRELLISENQDLLRLHYGDWERLFQRNDLFTNLWTVPFPRNPNFVGRSQELEKLHSLLQSGETVGVRPAMLSGLGGIGKTQLAVEYAYRYQAAYPQGIFWVNAIGDPASDWPRELAGLAEKIGISSEKAAESERQARLVQDLGKYMNARPKALVVFDNVEDPRYLQSPVCGWIPIELKCRLLFTTRRRDRGLQFAQCEVRQLPEQAGLRLLLSYRPELLKQLEKDNRDPELAAAAEIYRLLGGLPLALALAAAYLGQAADITLAAYATRLRIEGGLTTVDAAGEDLDDLPTRHEAAVKATLGQQWAALSSPEARLILQTAAIQGEAVQVPLARLSLLSGLAEQPLKEGYPAPLSLAFQRLSRLWLVEELTGSSVRLHPLVSEFARGEIADPDRFTSYRYRTPGAGALTPGVLAEQMARRGIDSLLEDLRSGQALLKGASRIGAGGSALRDLAQLERILDQEAHHLRRWDPRRCPAYFLQQLAWRARRLGVSVLARHAEEHLQSQGQPYIQSGWCTWRSDPALRRVLAGHTNRVETVGLHSDGRRAVSASWDGTLRVWELETGACLHVLAGHTSMVNAVALHPDGRRAVSASADSTLRVWDLETGASLLVLAGHTGGVNALALHPDGRRVVSASWDKTLRVWDLTTGACLQVLAGHTSVVTAVALGRDGRQLVSASYDGTLRVWDLVTRACLKVLAGHTSVVTAVVLHPDGWRVVSASWDNTLRVWNLMTGACLQILAGHTDGVPAVALHPDGRRVISASWDGTLRVWELATGVCLQVLAGHTREVTAVTLDSDGHRVISTSKDGTLQVWELKTGARLQKLSGHTSAVTAVALHPDGQRAISASLDSTLRVWNLEKRASLPVSAGHTGWVNAVALHPDGRRAISASYDGTLRVWDLDVGDCPQVLAGHTNWVTAVALHVDGWRVVSASADGTLRVWDLETGSTLRELVGHTREVCAVALHPDGRRLVSASYDYTLRVWDLEMGRRLQVLAGHTSVVTAVVLHSDGRRVISASRDNTLRVWDLETGTNLRVLAGHTAIVNTVALHRDGRRVISTSLDSSLQVWDLETGTRLHKLTAHTAVVTAVSLHPDGRRAISSSLDRTLRVWDLETGACLCVLAGHTDGVYTVALYPDGRRAVSASIDGTLRVWDLATGRELVCLSGERISVLAITPTGWILAGEAGGNMFYARLWEPESS